MDGPRISTVTGAMMVSLAVFFDAMQFLMSFVPLFGWVASSMVTAVAALTFGIMCSHLGVSLLNSKRALGFVGTIAGEAVPIVNGMWWWTVLMSYTVMTEWRKGTKTDAET